ncbi:MAG: rhomboid family intramembrane serine protease [Clostridiales bacterium]|nr:rhomboid family intramembrane serine protease [Clostridiales bacterium]
MDTKKLWNKINPRKWVDLASPVTLAFAGLSLAALIINWISAGGANLLLFSVYRSAFSDFFAYPRVFLHVLGHANYAHFAANMALFLVLGPLVEKQYGAKHFILMIVITALMTGLIHLLISATSAALGASGIVFMLILLSAASGWKNNKVPLTLLLVAIIYLGREIAGGVFHQDGVSQVSHLVGGLCGWAFGMYFQRKKA